MSTSLRTTRLISNAGTRLPEHVTRPVGIAGPAIRQDTGGGMSPSDPDANLPGFQASRYFRPLSSKGTMSTQQITRAVEDSRGISTMNGIGKRTIQIMCNYVLGSGMTFDCKGDTEELSAWLKEYSTGYGNQLHIEQFDQYKAWLRDGEQVPFAHVNEETGMTSWSMLDCLDISDAIAESATPEGGRLHKAGKLLVRDGVDLEVKTGKLNDDGTPETQKLKELKVARQNKDGYLEGDCLFFSLDPPAKSLRGIPLLYPVIDWIVYIDSYLMGCMENMAAQGQFIWDLLLKGIPPDKLADEAEKFPKRFDPGQVWVRNENVELTALSPDYSKASGMDAFGLFILSYVLGSVGLPRHWFAQPEGTNLASSIAAGEPTFRMLSFAQLQYKGMEWMKLDYALDQALRLGKLKMTPKERATIQITCPPIDVRDVARVGGILAGATGAIIMGEEKAYTTREEAAGAYRSLLGELSGSALEAEIPDEPNLDEQMYKRYKEKLREVRLEMERV